MTAFRLKALLTTIVRYLPPKSPRAVDFMFLELLPRFVGHVTIDTLCRVGIHMDIEFVFCFHHLKVESVTVVR